MVGAPPDPAHLQPGRLELLVANEAEPSSATADVVCTISIIDMSGGAAAATVVNTIGFVSLDSVTAASSTASAVELLGEGQTSAIPVHASQLDGVEHSRARICLGVAGWTRADVALQEVNAVAVIDLPILRRIADRDPAARQHRLVAGAATPSTARTAILLQERRNQPHFRPAHSPAAAGRHR